MAIDEPNKEDIVEAWCCRDYKTAYQKRFENQPCTITITQYDPFPGIYLLTLVLVASQFHTGSLTEQEFMSDETYSHYQDPMTLKWIQRLEKLMPTQENERAFAEILAEIKDQLPVVRTLLPDSENMHFGEIQVANTAPQTALFRMKGLNRRWDFGLNEDDGGYNYAFIIKPDGAGVYYDFSSITPGKTTKGSQAYQCELDNTP
ncbi:MAG: hypothetical protein OXI88_04560 [Gammaproteobacteria bacterium]|nr:hypothetical protein [Gammaproteobacteria bacterium]